MNKPKLTALLVLLVSAAAVRAQAQIVELGAGVGGVGLADGGGDFWGTGLRGATLDARVSVAMNDRFAVEPFVTYGRRTRSIPPGYGASVYGYDIERTEGLFGVAVRQRLRVGARPGFHAYLRYGLTGVYSHEYSAPQQILVRGRTVVTGPEWSEDRRINPWLPIVGAGIHKSLGSHLALRAETEMVTFLFFPIGARGSVGVAVPLGRASSTPTR